MPTEPSLRPTNKVAAGALAGAIVTVGTWLTPADEPAAVIAALVVIVTFATSYFVKD
jgi:hypothetical protein